MPDAYHIPALVLTALLLPAFGFLYLRFRNTRTLLWLLGFLFAVIRMLLNYNLGFWDLSQGFHPWLTAVGQTSIQISSTLFLASLSPRRFRLGQFKILYVIPFTIPLVIYALLFQGVFQSILPRGPLFLVFPALLAVSLLVGCFWAAEKGSIHRYLGVAGCMLLGSLGLWVCFTPGGLLPLVLAECAIHFSTALLLLVVFRRISPGTILSSLGFLVWSMYILLIWPALHLSPVVHLDLCRLVFMAKVVAGVGLILLVVEDQLAINQEAQKRERRAHRELRAYTNLILSRRRVVDFDRQGEEICQTVAEHSRFAQAALLLQTEGRYRLVGAAGLDAARVTALEKLAARIPVASFLKPGSAPSVISQTLALDLTPWLLPGDDLKGLRFTSALAVPMVGRSNTEGALLLAGIRNLRGPGSGRLQDKIRVDDLLPIEMLVARLQAARSQTMMFEKLVDSEKFAGLGQLAANVSQQLNNPLTVILGYASLLEETAALDQHDRKCVTAILTEARRMRSTLESVSRVTRSHSDQLTAVSVSELLADIEELHRAEFLARSIQFRLTIAPALPRVLCHAQQLRHAVLHCLQFAMEAVASQDEAMVPAADFPQTIRLEATSEGNRVQILIAHSGPGFLHPDRAFDPYASLQATGEPAGLGLSLCATILREHNGRASAVNFESRGAGIILELQAA